MSYPPQGWTPSSPSLGFGEALRLAWARKFEMSGRARRSEFWWTQLGVFLLVVAAEVVIGLLVAVAAAATRGSSVGLAIVFSLAGLLLLGLLVVLFPVQLTLSARRLHDVDRSAWWLLIGFVPTAGAIVLLVFHLLDSSPGPNRFGPSPKDAPGGRPGPGGYPGSGYSSGGYGQAPIGGHGQGGAEVR